MIKDHPTIADRDEDGPGYTVDLEAFNERIKRLYADYNRAVDENRYAVAIRIGKEILNDLLTVAREQLIPNVHNPEIRRLIEDIVRYHEKNLGYVEATEDAAENVPPLYQFEIRERALGTLSSSIQELFSFILGAMLVLADVNSTVYRPSKKPESPVGFI